MIITEELVRRVEQSVVDDAVLVADALRHVDADDPVLIEELGGGVALLLGPGSYINRAMGLGLHGPVSAGAIDRIEELSRAAGVDPAVEICPLAHPTLHELLGMRCYRLTGFRTVLCRDLATEDLVTEDLVTEELAIKELDPADPVLAIHRVDESTLADWQTSAVHGFGIADDAGRAVSDRFSTARFHTPGESFFLAWLDGNVAANAALTVRDGVATLGGMATNPTFRRRGVQAAMIRHRLRFAADAGCDLAVVAADPGSASERNLQRFGFRIAYTEIFMSGAAR